MKKNRRRKNNGFAEIEIKYVIGDQSGSVIIDSETRLKGGELAIGIDNQHTYFEMPLSEAHTLSLVIQSAISIFQQKDL